MKNKNTLSSSDVNTTVNVRQTDDQKFLKRIDQIIDLENSIQLKRRRDLMEAMLSTLTDEQYAKFQTRYRELLHNMEYSPANINLKELKKAWEYIFTK